MDSKSNGNKVWVTKLRHDIRIRELDEALSRHRLRAEEIRLLPRGRAVLIFDQQSGASSCVAKRDIFRDLGDKLGSGAFMMKYQPGFEDGAFRGQANLIQTQLSKDVLELFSRSPPAVKYAYDYLDNNVLGLLDTLSDDEDLFDRREDGHRDRNDSRHREDYGRDDNRRVEPPRPGTPEVEYAVVNKNRAKKTPTDLPENGSHRREDDNGHAERPRRREDRSPDEPRGRAPETSLVNTPGHVKAYIRSVYRDDLMKMKSKYGVLFRDHPDGTIVEATGQCEPGSLGDACQELKAMCREVAGFVKETTIQLDKYGLRMDDVMSQLRDIEQNFPEVLFSRRHDNALNMVGDENDLFKAKTTLLDATQPGDRETRSRGKRDGHRRKDGDRDGDRGRKRRGDRDRSEDRHLGGDYDRDGDRGRKNRGDRDRAKDRHLDGDYDRDGDRGRKNRGDRDRSEDRHLDGDYDRTRRGDRDDQRTGT
ncbi:hypothetical protein LSAT2_015568 [Lamellibrachia satsuma]|nr:hypothetical protein LSAT2_015568 [Lamellibrachia satsuma]